MASAWDSLHSMLVANPVSATLIDAYSSFSERRAKLGLSNPGTVEGVSREVQRDVFLASGMFEGLRGDITKVMSLAPVFHTSHALSMAEGTSPYTFRALYGSDKVFLQGNYDYSGVSSGSFNYRLTQKLISKAQVQLSPSQDYAQFEQEYNGDDFTASVKAINPSLLGGGLTGIIMGQYLQSVTPKLSLGLEAAWQRPSMTQGPESSVSYVGRYKSADWVATGSFLAQGALTASYWKKFSERVQAGAELTLRLEPTPGMMGGIKKEGITTVGARYDFRMASLRTQIDSKGKLGMLLEKRFPVPVTLTLACDMDYPTQKAKVGVGIILELAEGLQEQQESGIQSPNLPI